TLVVLEQDRSVLQEDGPLPPLRAPDQLPPAGDDLARRGDGEAGNAPLGRAGRGPRGWSDARRPRPPRAGALMPLRPLLRYRPCHLPRCPFRPLPRPPHRPLLRRDFRRRPEPAQPRDEREVDRTVRGARRADRGDRGRDAVRHLPVVIDRLPARRPPDQVDPARGRGGGDVGTGKRLVPAEREAGRGPTVKAEG